MRNYFLSAGLPILAAALPFPAPTTLAQQSPPPELIHLMQRGAEAIHQNRAEDAVKIFREAEGVAPDLADAYLGAGMAEMKLGNFSEAAQSLQQAVRLNDQLTSAHLFLGITLYQQHLYEESAAALAAEMKLQPENAEVFTWFGMAELAAGHAELATGPLDKADALKPGNPEILDYRSRAHSLVALASFQQLYQIAPNSWQIHRSLAELSDTTHQTQQAIAEYKTAIGLKPDNPDLYEALGLELQKASLKDEAMHAYEKAIELNPGSPVAQLELGKLYVEAEQCEKGMPLLRGVVPVQPLAGAAHYYMGVGEAQLGHTPQAVAEYEAALRATPEPLLVQNSWYALSRLYAKLGRTGDAQHALDEFKKVKASRADQKSQ